MLFMAFVVPFAANLFLKTGLETVRTFASIVSATFYYRGQVVHLKRQLERG